MYEEGRGIASDPVQAVAWYRRAARQDHADAHLALGMACALGEGITRNFLEAFDCFTRAASHGIESAAELRCLVTQELKRELDDMVAAQAA